MRVSGYEKNLSFALSLSVSASSDLEMVPKTFYMPLAVNAWSLHAAMNAVMPEGESRLPLEMLWR